MAVLEVVINNKVYQIGCDDSEKEYIKSMVEELNTRIEKQKKQNAGFFEKLSDEKLFLYQLLITYNELKEIKNKKIKIESSAAKESRLLAEKEVQQLDSIIDKINKSSHKLDKLLSEK